MLHIEIQHSHDGEFPLRMFTYFYRIFDRYNRDIASLAILADRDKNWRPNQYHRKIWNSEITRSYEVVKLIDYKSRREELLKSDNPFALVVLIQLDALETTPKDEQRLMTKLEYFRSLHKKGWDIEKSMNVYKFLDIILNLNTEYRIQYMEQARQINQQFNTNLMGDTGRYFYQKGLAGILLEQLKLKFQDVPQAYITKIEKAIEEDDSLRLEGWSRNFVFANSLEDVFKA